jgi:phosphonate transport system substrate-binding protein
MERSPLPFVSLLSKNREPFYRALAAALAARTGIAIELASPEGPEERRATLHRGVGALCGWLLARWRADGGAPGLVPLAAPILSEARYRDEPIYFSDVIVRADRPYRTFEDLRGAAWCYNETGSFSGYLMMLERLASLGETIGFFGSNAPTGTHLASLERVLEGSADCTAIDSTVLAAERPGRPGLAEDLRIITSLGPAAIPPLVASAALDEDVRERLCLALLALDKDLSGRQLLATGGLSRFVPIDAARYDEFWTWARRAEPAGRLPASDHPFLAPQRDEEDRQLLDAMVTTLRALARKGEGLPIGHPHAVLHLAEAGGRGHRVIVNDANALLSGADLSVIGFFGLKRAGIDSNLLDRLDRELVGEFPAYADVASYSTLELADGVNHANLVLLRADSAIEHWRTSAKHAEAVRDHAPRIYEAVRIHKGALPGGLAGSEAVHLLSTKRFDYRSG